MDSWTYYPSNDCKSFHYNYIYIYRSSHITFVSIQLQKKQIDRWSDQYGAIPAFDLQASLQESQVHDLSQTLMLKCEDKTLKTFILKVNVQGNALLKGKW